MTDEYCPSCQAPRGPGDVFCWMCQRRWDAAPEGSERPGGDVPSEAPAPGSAPAPEAAPSASALGRTLPVLIGAQIVILVGMARSSGTGIALGGLLLVLAMFVTGVDSLRQHKTPARSVGEGVMRVFGMVLTVVALMCAAVAAVLVALFAVCFAVLAGATFFK